VGLSDKADVRTRALSGGQRRRLDLALGVVGDPEVLFLDEPTTGFDPSARRRAWDLIGSLRTLGTTILLTTHYMEEAEHLADRVGVIDSGRLIALDTPERLVSRAARAVISFQVPDAVSVPEIGLRRRTKGAELEIESAQPTADLHALTEWALQGGVELEGLALGRPSLEDVYLDLTAGQKP
jgi:ABC-2 type transport system ATP-binding protein